MVAGVIVGKGYPRMSQLVRATVYCDPCWKVKCREYYRRKVAKAGRTNIASQVRWTKEEDELLLSGEPVPGRSALACESRRHQLGVIESCRWSMDDVKLLKKLAGTISTKEMSERFFMGRSPNAIQKLAAKHGICLKLKRERLHSLTDRQRGMVPAAVEMAVPKSLPAQVRSEVVQSLSVAVLERRVAFKDIAKQVKPYITKVYAMFPNFGAPVSLDTPIFDDGHTTLGDRIESTAFRF